MPRKFKLTLIPILILTSCIISIAAIISVNVNSMIDLTPTTFQPIGSTGTSFTVSDRYGVPIARVAAGNHYPGDPETHYPGIAVYTSDPYRTTPLGVIPTSFSNVPVMKLIVDGKVYFLHEAWFTVDVLAKTMTNIPNRKDTTQILSPFDGMDHTHNLLTEHYTIERAPDILGSLAMLVKTDTAGWPRQHATGIASITSSLERIDFKVGKHNGGTPGLTYQDALLKLQTNYGTSGVIVRPTINLAAYSDYITYTYTRNATLSNGTRAFVTIDTASAQVGFGYATQTDDHNLAGAIPNSFPVNYTRAAVSVLGNTATARNTDSASIDSVSGPNYQVTTSVYGSVEYKSWLDTQVPLTGTMQPGNFVIPDNVNISIDLNDLNHYSLRQNMSATADFALRPIAIATIAHTQVKGMAWFFDGWLIGGESTMKPIDDPLEYPYRLDIHNVYAMSKLTFKVNIITENELQILTETGRPIDPSTLVDFDLNSIIMNPSDDDIKMNLSWESFDWDKFWGDLFGGIGGIVLTVLIIVVVIAVIWVVSKFGFLFKRRH